MTRLLALWAQLWADFNDEFSLTVTRDRVRIFLSTTPARFVIYAVVLGGLSFGLLALCDGGGVGAPTPTITATPE